MPFTNLGLQITQSSRLYEFPPFAGMTILSHYIAMSKTLTASPSRPHGQTADAQSTPAPPMSESHLVERCRAGDIQAFDELVHCHQERIFSLCYWMLGNRDEAADAAQDAFIRAYRSLKAFRGDSSFGTWLHRIAVNTSIDAMHRRRRAPVPYCDLRSEDDSSSDGDREDAREQEVFAPMQSTPLLSPDKAALQHEQQIAVRGALADLPEHYRIALVLFDIEGYTYDEISAALNLPMGTVKSRINRARAALRDRLLDHRELFNELAGL